MTYRASGADDVLEIELGDGSIQRVIFASPSEALRALRRGRSILDRIALERAILPLGGLKSIKRVPKSLFGDVVASGKSDFVPGYMLGFQDSQNAAEKSTNTDLRTGKDFDRYHALAAALHAEAGGWSA
ncbi:hypothetical protein [Sphingomonas sp. BK069]|uniref:hypothetical protein n=1 Tax=Sphingomonas sp. BK069 TaxID=2586979 RepID=UPI00185E5B32|nr:hypothetical protein [Sphingomonas sp. BK069]MBB3348404.1 hypothetical protein [Sphingomonas sp. BK069]